MGLLLSPSTTHGYTCIRNQRASQWHIQHGPGWQGLPEYWGEMGPRLGCQLRYEAYSLSALYGVQTIFEGSTSTPAEPASFKCLYQNTVLPISTFQGSNCDQDEL